MKAKEDAKAGEMSQGNNLSSSPRKKLLISLLVGISILVIPSMITFQLLVQTHPLYDFGVRQLESSFEVTEALGTPLETSWWIYGRIVKGHALYLFPVRGPGGEGEVRMVAHRKDRLWRVEYIMVRLVPSGRRITIAKDLPLEAAASE